jgi:hypothetical protein
MLLTHRWISHCSAPKKLKNPKLKPKKKPLCRKEVARLSAELEKARSLAKQLRVRNRDLNSELLGKSARGTARCVGRQDVNFFYARKYFLYKFI